MGRRPTSPHGFLASRAAQAAFPHEQDPLGRPGREATNIIELQAAGTGTALRLFETPTKGPGAWLNNPRLEALLHKRLVEMLDRLRRIYEGKAGMTPSPE